MQLRDFLRLCVVAYLLNPLLRRGLGPFCAVLGTALLPVRDTGGVERTTNDVIANAGKVLYTATADEHDRVLLEVMPFAGDVGGDLEPVGEPHPSDLPQRGVGLLRGRGVNTGADATLLRAAL